MKFIFLLGFWVITLSLSGQAHYTYYLTGRPYSIEHNNAIKTVGEEWKISFEYAGSDVIEMAGLEKINALNDSISLLIGDKTGLGEGWQTVFYAEVSVEEEKQQLIRKLVQIDPFLIEMQKQLFETFLLVEKKRCFFKKRYYVYLVGQLKTDESRKFASHGKYKVNLKKMSAKLVSSKLEALPFSIVQNGIQ